MALIAFMTIDGHSQGQITTGGSLMRGRENSVGVIKFEHEVSLPTDAASGRATGRRFHRPVIITKEIDRTSPLLSQAMCNAESLTVRLKFWRPMPDGTGRQEHFYTITLTNAHITSIRSELPFVNDPSTAQYPCLEVVSFAFEEIESVYENGGISHIDRWTAPTRS